jgi:hypothetical protein
MTRIIDFHTKNRAKYTYHIDLASHTIEIREIKGPKTVASDAENVIEDLAIRGYSVDEFVIRYQNSLGSWGQLLTTNSVFSGFLPVESQLPRAA